MNGTARVKCSGCNADYAAEWTGTTCSECDSVIAPLRLADKIKSYLAENKNNAVVIATALRATVIQQKDVEKFAKAGYELVSGGDDRGFYLQSGKRKVYVLAGGCDIRFTAYR